MLSTFILLTAGASEAPPSLGGLVRTLSALVPGTVGGIVRDVTIVTDRASEDIREVADHAGCSVVEDAEFGRGLRTAVGHARSSTLFLLRAGASVDRAFLDEVAQALGPAQTDKAAPVLVLREAPDGLVRRVLPDLAPAAGLIAQASAVDLSAKTFDALVRRANGKRTLAARAAMVH